MICGNRISSFYWDNMVLCQKQETQYGIVSEKQYGIVPLTQYGI